MCRGNGGHRCDGAANLSSWYDARGFWGFGRPHASTCMARELCHAREGWCWASVEESRPAGLDSLMLGHVQGIGLVGLLLRLWASLPVGLV